ncbi:hypothetical protein CR513_08836, partial [Mucuna pruriens]
MESLKPISMSIEEKLKLTKESEDKRMDPTQYKISIGSTLGDRSSYANNNDVKLVGCIDSNWARDEATRKSMYWCSVMVFKETPNYFTLNNLSKIHSSN